MATSIYRFVIPGFDGGRTIFGPSIGTPGLVAQDEAFAIPTIDGEWFLLDPTVAGSGGGVIEEETDPIAMPALAEHEAATTDVHGIADTAALATDAEVVATVSALAAAVAADLAAHAADTTAIHGIADTSQLVLTSDLRLTNERVPTDGSVTAAKIAAGIIVNSHIAAAAAIAYSKLNLTGSITNADIAAAAGIAKSKLAALNIANADIAAAAGIAYSKLSLGNSIVNSDIAAAAAIAYSKLSLAGSVVNADIAAAAAIAESKLNLATDAAAGTGSRRTLGTGALQAAAGNHTHVVGVGTAMPWGPGWTDYTVSTGWAPAQYVTDITGYVNLRGLAARTSGTGIIIATFPAGFRPLHNRAFIIHAFTGSAFSEGRLDLAAATGQLTLVLPGTITNTGYITLEQIRWKAEQ